MTNQNVALMILKLERRVVHYLWEKYKLSLITASYLITINVHIR